jgi:hypothetical protein
MIATFNDRYGAYSNSMNKFTNSTPTVGLNNSTLYVIQSGTDLSKRNTLSYSGPDAIFYFFKI